MLKKYVNGAWEDAKSLKIFRNDLWENASFANRYDPETQTWVKVFPNSALAEFFSSSSDKLGNRFSYSLSHAGISVNGAYGNTNSGYDLIFKIPDTSSLGNVINLKFDANLRFSNIRAQMTFNFMGSNGNLLKNEFWRGNDTSGSSAASTLNGTVNITISLTEPAEHVRIIFHNYMSTLSGTLSNIFLNDVPVYFTE